MRRLREGRTEGMLLKERREEGRGPSAGSSLCDDGYDAAGGDGEESFYCSRWGGWIGPLFLAGKRVGGSAVEVAGRCLALLARESSSHDRRAFGDRRC